MIPFIKKIFNHPEGMTIVPEAVIVDVRSKNEFASGHLEGALNIPLEQVESKIEELKKYPQVVVYCRSGNRSAHAKKILTSGGISHVLDVGSLEDAQSLVKASGHHPSELIKEELSVETQEIAGLKDENILKVLIPTDFSVQADFSYLMVRKLEEHLSVDIHFLHVIDVPDTVTMDVSGNIVTCGEIDVKYVNDQKSIAETKLNHLREQYGNHVSVHLKFGKVTDSILGFAESNHFDLIVMGTKGAWGVKEKLSSTQAQIIARRSHVPLLSLMCDRSDLIIKDILFVHDFLEEDDAGISLMFTFSKYFNAMYHLLYVHNTVSINNLRIEENIEKYATKHNIKNYQSHILEAKDVETGVNDFLKTQDADIVFIGTHGKGGFFHKSAAETLIKHLFKPIISFHLNS